jgi:hypothetical protein
LRQQFADEQLSGISEAWKKLFREAESLLSEDPANEKAQDFVARWLQVWLSTTRGDAGIRSGLQKAWADRANWPPEIHVSVAEERFELRDASQIRQRLRRE